LILNRNLRHFNPKTFELLKNYVTQGHPVEDNIFREAIFERIDAQVKLWGCDPVAICIDSVYKAIDGDLNENRDIIGFTNAIDDFISRYHSAILLIHHDAKEWRDDKMQTIDRGDKGAYGSVFLRAYVDHILYLKMHKTKARTLTCDTQRSGKTHGDVIDLLMVEPSPLCFQLRGDYKPSTEIIIHQLRLNSQASYSQLIAATGLAQITLQQGIAVLLKDKKVGFIDNKERYFFLKN